MNTIQNFIAKGTIAAFILLAGALSVSSAQAYTVSPYQYQFSDNQYQYQVYSAPVQMQYQAQYYDQRLQMLLAQIAQLQRLLQQLQSTSIINVDYDWDYDTDYDDSEVEIQTRSATDVQDDSARLRGIVSDFNRSDYADVWFEYGTVRSNLNKRTPITRIDEDEDEDFSFRITGLRDDTRYYYRAVGEDDDEEKDYGSILDLRTDDDRYNSNDRDDDEKPDVTTRNAFNVDEDSARFEGEVDMNDFRNGEVFIVYGEDEDQVDDIADDYDTYSDVDEDGDDLQKFLVDRDLDGSSSYEARVTGLDDNTDYYFALCVGYEDEDDDDVIECSSTRDFETDY
jgi:hypothetical protein